jgi:hypothetical protein
MRRLCDAPEATTLVGLRDANTGLIRDTRLRSRDIDATGDPETWDRGYVILVCGKTETEEREAHLSPEAKRLIDAWIQRRPVLSQYTTK